MPGNPESIYARQHQTLVSFHQNIIQISLKAHEHDFMIFVIVNYCANSSLMSLPTVKITRKSPSKRLKTAINHYSN